MIGARKGLGAVWISAMSVAEAGSVCGLDAVHVGESESDASPFVSMKAVNSGSCQTPEVCRLARNNARRTVVCTKEA